MVLALLSWDLAGHDGYALHDRYGLSYAALLVLGAEGDNYTVTKMQLHFDWPLVVVDLMVLAIILVLAVTGFRRWRRRRSGHPPSD